MKVSSIPTLKDNYSYALIEKNHAISIVDPGESNPIIQFCQTHNLKISSILITHHHADHTGGIKGLLETFPNATVITPDEYKDSRTLPNLSTPIQSFKTPGHTLDHICYYIAPYLFTGDLLFHLGCGRIFEGTLEQMFESLQSFHHLPDSVLMYPGHEYTRGNIEFCKSLFTGTQLEEKYIEIEKKLPIGQPTIPTTLGEQRQYNPFMSENVETFTQALGLDSSMSAFEFFAMVRQKKDCF